MYTRKFGSCVKLNPSKLLISTYRLDLSKDLQNFKVYISLVLFYAYKSDQVTVNILHHIHLSSQNDNVLPSQ